MTNEPDHRPDSPTISGVCPAVEPPSKQPDHIFEPYDANPGICRHCGAVKPFPCYASFELAALRGDADVHAFHVQSGSNLCICGFPEDDVSHAEAVTP